MRVCDLATQLGTKSKYIIEHCTRIGLPVKHPNQNLSDSQVIEIRKLYPRGPSGSTGSGLEIGGWLTIASVAIWVVTMLFFMVLVLLEPVPRENRFLVVIVLALGTGLGGGCTLGSAAIHGKLIPFLNQNPLRVSATGTIAAFLLVVLVGYYVYVLEPPIINKKQADINASKEAIVEYLRNPLGTIMPGSLNETYVYNLVRQAVFRSVPEWKGDKEILRNVLSQLRRSGELTIQDKAFSSSAEANLFLEIPNDLLVIRLDWLRKKVLPVLMREGRAEIELPRKAWIYFDVPNGRGPKEIFKNISKVENEILFLGDSLGG